MAIDVGPGATDRAKTDALANVTFIDIANPANAHGILTSFEIWAYANLAGCKIGTFFGSGTSYTMRDSVTIGDVTAGSKQTFIGKSVRCAVGDFLGIYYATGKIEYDTSGGSGVYGAAGDKFNGVAAAYGLYASNVMSIYATGTETALNHEQAHQLDGGFNQLNGGMQ
jgi:hypothetical protein